MKVDVSKSAYQEAPGVRGEFDRAELRRLRFLLRRLRYLEAQVRKTGGVNSAETGAAYSEWEVEALEWILMEVGFLSEKLGEAS